MGSNSSEKKGDNLPATDMTWIEAATFCNQLLEREGKEAAYTIKGNNVTCNWDAKGYRLPSEAEWEYEVRAPAAVTQGARAKDLSYAARGGKEHQYVGSDNLDEVAWYTGNSGGTIHPVGQKKPNGFGLYDMSGNVCDWVLDFRVDKEYQNRDGVKDPKGPTNVSLTTSRGFHSGAYSEAIVNQQYSYRNGIDATYAKSYIGLRVVMLA